MARRVEADVDSADDSGVRGTPTFFVNGRRRTGAYDIDTFCRARCGQRADRWASSPEPWTVDDSAAGSTGRHATMPHGSEPLGRVDRCGLPAVTAGGAGAEPRRVSRQQGRQGSPPQVGRDQRGMEGHGAARRQRRNAASQPRDLRRDTTAEHALLPRPTASRRPSRSTPTPMATSATPASTPRTSRSCCTRRMTPGSHQTSSGRSRFSVHTHNAYRWKGHKSIKVGMLAQAPSRLTRSTRSSTPTQERRSPPPQVSRDGGKHWRTVGSGPTSGFFTGVDPFFGGGGPLLSASKPGKYLARVVDHGADFQDAARSPAVHIHVTKRKVPAWLKYTNRDAPQPRPSDRLREEVLRQSGPQARALDGAQQHALPLRAAGLPGTASRATRRDRTASSCWGHQARCVPSISGSVRRSTPPASCVPHGRSGGSGCRRRHAQMVPAGLDWSSTSPRLTVGSDLAWASH